MSRKSVRRDSSVLLVVMFVGGCPDAGEGVLSTTGDTDGTGQGTTSWGSGTLDGLDETGVEPSDPCRPDSAMFSTHSVAVDAFAFSPVGLCDGLQLPHFNVNPVPDVEVYIYRPDDAGDWPNEPPRPAMFFVPGAYQFVVERPPFAPEEHYDHVFDDIVEEGIPVFAVQPLTGVDQTFGREALLACVMTWAKTAPGQGGWERSGDTLIGEGAVIAGHSRGGAATNFLVNHFDDLVALLPPMAEYELCAVAQIAPRWSDDSPQDNVTTIFTSLEDAAPLFVIQGSADEDTRSQGVSSFDAMASEDLAVAVEPGLVDSGSLGLFDKIFLWVYGVRHNDFGGRGDIPAGVELDRADATGPTYLAGFLRWQLFGDLSARAKLLAAVEENAVTADFPACTGRS